MQNKYEEFKRRVEKVGEEDENNRVVPDRPPRVEVSMQQNTQNQQKKYFKICLPKKKKKGSVIFTSISGCEVLEFQILILIIPKFLISLIMYHNRLNSFHTS